MLLAAPYSLPASGTDVTIEVKVQSSSPNRIESHVHLDFMERDTTFQSATIEAESFQSVAVSRCRPGVKVVARAADEASHFWPQAENCVIPQIVITLVEIIYSDPGRFVTAGAPTSIRTGPSDRNRYLRQTRLDPSQSAEVITYFYGAADLPGIAFAANEASWSARRTRDRESEIALRNVAIEAAFAAIGELGDLVATETGRERPEPEQLFTLNTTDSSLDEVVMTAEGQSLLRAFQGSQGLQPTGVLDPSTFEALTRLPH